PSPTGGLAQHLYFRTGQPAGLAGGQRADLERTQGGAAQAHDLVPQPGEHAPDLAVLALIEDDLQPGAVTLRLEALDTRRLNASAAQPDTFEQLAQVFRRGMAGHLDLIRLRHAEPGVREAVGQVAIVGEQQQPLAGLVEPAHRVDALADLRHEVDGPRPAGG